MRFNLKRISILSFFLLDVTLICTGNDNRLVVVTDEVEEATLCDCKEYHAINRFTSMDRFAEKYPWQSPYVHAGNNPVNFVDVAGDGVNISGSEQQTAFQETQISVSGELELTLQNTEAIIATQITTGTLSANAQQLMDAINSETITVNIVTTNGYTDENGNLIIGGSFGGNTVTQMANGNMVIATQTINPQVLRTMSNAHGTPGKDVLHEITEAYQGALISQQSGVSSPPANQPGSVYPQAHNSATPQSGTVIQTVYGAYGMPMPAMPSGNYPYPNQIQRVEWSVMDTSNQRIIIQSLP